MGLKFDGLFLSVASRIVRRQLEYAAFVQLCPALTSLDIAAGMPNNTNPVLVPTLEQAKYRLDEGLIDELVCG